MFIIVLIVIYMYINDASALDKLDEFENLTSVDFLNSPCIEAINEWSVAHPSVNISYHYEIADGLELNNTTKSVDLSSAKLEDIDSLMPILENLPELKDVELGNISTGIGYEKATLLKKSLPNISFTGQVNVLGKEYTLDTDSFDLSNAAHEDVADIISAFSFLNNNKSLDFGNENSSVLSFDDIAALEKAAPSADYSYSFTLYGHDYNANTRKINLSHVSIDDDGEAVRQALKIMPLCDYLDMDSTGVDNEHMAVIRDENPNVEVIWRVFFGYAYSVRTNVETILASDSFNEGELVVENSEALKYCTKVKRLDIGHNRKLQRIDFVSYMPDLEVLIICDSPALENIEPIANCPKLENAEIIAATKNHRSQPALRAS